MNKLIDSALILTALTAILYSSGTAYHNGMLATLSLSPALLEKSFHQLLYTGFLQACIPLFIITATIVVFLTLVSELYFPLVQRLYNKSFSWKKRIIKFLKRFSYNHETERIKRARAKTYSSLLVFFVLVGVLSFLRCLEIKGAQQGQEYLSVIGKKECDKDNIIIEKTSNKAFCTIACGTNHCAVVDQETGISVYLSPDEFTFFIDANKKSDLL